MTNVLQQKIVKLVRGEEGVALVVTLALFMFLYISCAGVYTVGKAVKERIILQNAVDAAAYSAAVVQADYLSRIATINKAMAWNYAQLLKAQRNWIRQEFLRRIKIAQEPYLNSTLTSLENAEIGSIRTVNPVVDLISLYSEGDRLKYGGDDGTGGKVGEYSEKIYGQSNALAELRDGMMEKMGESIDAVLKANLPYRLGELCYRKVNTNDVLEVLVDEEAAFLEMSQDPNEETLNLPSSVQWFWFDDNGDEGLNRVFKGPLSLESWTAYNDDISHGKKCDKVDADDPSISGVYKDAYFQDIAKPLKLKDGYSPTSDKPAEGAITVAVAKKNENPWLGLIADLTGFYSAFDHADKNDWTFVVASAQAGWRSGGDDSKGEAREYSLSGDGFLGTSKNLSETDWDAVYVPLRSAFTPHGTDFAGWMESEADWKPLIPVADRDYVKEPLEEIRFDELNHEALPRMHNNGGSKKNMNWFEEDGRYFLDLMYH